MCEFLLLPFVEFEIRFGTITGTKFDSCVDKRYFEKIVNTLETGIFENVVTKTTTEYIKDSLKMVDETQIIMKENIKNVLKVEENVTLYHQLDTECIDIFANNSSYIPNCGME